MSTDVTRLIEFYKSPLGKISRALVREEVMRLGGNVRGRTIYGQWPGLNKTELNEGRDLAITTDFRAVMSTLAEKHMRIPDSALQQIFPQYTTGMQHVSNILV